MNPEQRRLIMAFAAIVVVMFIWTLTSRTPARKPPAPGADTTATAVKPAGAEPEIVATDTLVVDRPDYRLVLTKTGGAVKSFYVKQYRVEVVPEGKFLFISRDSAGGAVAFAAAVTGDSVTFTGKAAGSAVRKTYRFAAAAGFTLDIAAEPATPVALSLRSGLSITELKNARDDLRYFSVYVKNEKVANVTRLIKDELDFLGTWRWIGLRSKYFVLILNNGGIIDRTIFSRIPAHLTPPAKKVSAGFGCAFTASPTSQYGLLLVGPRIKLSVSLLPLKPAELAKYHEGYESIAGGGIWAPIARIILVLFNFFYAIFKNYGVAIIIFAVILKAIFFPLSRQMIVSQHKMQMIQPELKKVQQKYKGDPQALNQEMMHLYKTYKVNPFSGCLPLLIQMPIFFALYQTLGSSFEFRQAPFLLWITDLSMKDPYYVLPIGMGAMMLVQSLMTTVDPRQRLMVLMMPVFMIFIFLNLPSGLQLYWFTYNIMTLVENYLVKKGGIK